MTWIGPAGRRDCAQRFSRRNSVFRLTGIPSRRLKRAPARPPKAWAIARPISPRRLVSRACDLRQALAKDPSRATSIAATPAADSHGQFHRLSLYWKVLQAPHIAAVADRKSVVEGK